MTATLTEQPTLDALESRCTLLTFPEAAIHTDSPDEGTTEFLVYVTGTAAPSAGDEDKIGTIMRLRPAHGPTWLDRHEDSTYHRYVGAMVNPEPVNGHHYRTIGGGASILLRYNDDDHVGDRNNRRYPWSLLRAEGETVWPVPDDGVPTLSAFPYIEVRFEAGDAADDEQPDTADSEAVTAVRTAVEEAEAAGPATIEDGKRTPTRGMAMKEEDGTVLLDPPLVQGMTYLFWRPEGFDEEYSDSYIQMFTGTDPLDAGAFRSIGQVDWHRSADAVRFMAGHHSTGITADSRHHWVKVDFTRPAPREEGTSTSTALTYITTMDEEEQQFSEFNEKVNDIAEDAGWCEEYDRIVKSVGMVSREHAWEVEVSVDFTFEDRNPTGSFDEEAREYHDLETLTINNASYRASATVTVRVDSAKDSDSAEEQVDSSMIESALRAQMEHASNIDVDDWTVQDTNEA